LVVAEKTQNLRRLEAQRNELNAKGGLVFIGVFCFDTVVSFRLSVNGLEHGA